MKKIITYCADNPQDVKNLFAIIDMAFAGVKYIKPVLSGRYELGGNGTTIINTSFNINFCGKKRIEHPVEIKVGQFGRFWDADKSALVFGFLIRIYDNGEYHYVDQLQTPYAHFIPITPESEEWAKICKAVKGE